MRTLLVLVLACSLLSCQESFQFKIYSKTCIEIELSKQFKQQISNFSIDTLFVTELWAGGAGFRREEGPTIPNIKVNETCVVVSFVVPKDSNGAKYLARYYVPFSFLRRETHKCYIKDKHLSGPHFNGIGHEYIPEDWFINILKQTCLYE